MLGVRDILVCSMDFFLQLSVHQRRVSWTVVKHTPTHRFWRLNGNSKHQSRCNGLCVCKKAVGLWTDGFSEGEGSRKAFAKVIEELERDYSILMLRHWNWEIDRSWSRRVCTLLGLWVAYCNCNISIVDQYISELLLSWMHSHIQRNHLNLVFFLVYAIYFSTVISIVWFSIEMFVHICNIDLENRDLNKICRICIWRS